MAKKKKEESDVLKEYVNSLIDEKLEGLDDDAKKIAEHLMPELEKIVSKIVLKHLRSIATYTLKQLKEE
jgi:hypothetical protein